jgi:hypothetical protein
MATGDSIVGGCLFVILYGQGIRWKTMRSSDPAASKKRLVRAVIWTGGFIGFLALAEPLHIPEGPGVVVCVGLALASFVQLLLVP